MSVCLVNRIGVAMTVAMLLAATRADCGSIEATKRAVCRMSRRRNNRQAAPLSRKKRFPGAAQNYESIRNGDKAGDELVP